MIIIQAAGGLGNQMQQYALYEKYRSLDIPVKLDISWFTQEKRQQEVYAKRELELLKFEDLSFFVCTEEEKQALLGSGGVMDKVKRKLFPNKNLRFEEFDMYHPELFEWKDKYLCGYFACEKYYADILPLLREKFRFPVSGNQENQRLAARMQEEVSVSLHVRRGDYLDAENNSMFGGICTEAYYEGAIKDMRERFENVRFYLFSDDPAYMKEAYQGDDFCVVDINYGEDSFYDMWLMSRCKHHICANSTFSFWGARLNGSSDKVMIRPSVHKNSQIFDAERMHMLWDGWVLMNKAGQVV